MKRHLAVLWAIAWAVTGPAQARLRPAFLAEPSVVVVTKRAATPDGADLTRALPDVENALRRRRYTTLPVTNAAQAICRIELSGATDPCPMNQSVMRYTLRLVAINNQTNEPIATLSGSPNCLSQPLDELAAKAVFALFESRAYERQRDDFFDNIRRHFARATPIAIRDTSGPMIEVFSPSLPPPTRGLARQSRVNANASVEIVGKVTDPSNVARLTLNGQPVVLEEKGVFRSMVSMSRSEYPIRLEAQDGAGNPTRIEFVLSPQAVTAAKPTTPLTDDRRLALVVGNGNYQSVPHLLNPPNDAKSIGDALQALGFTVIRCTNATRKSLIDATDEFGKQLAEGKFTVGLFYYAGHGVQHKGLNYLVPVEATMNSDAETDFVDVQRVLNKMEVANSRTNILIMDACRDDPFKSTRSLGSAYGPPAVMIAPTGTFIAFATAPGHTAADGTGQNGTYTECLLRHLPTPNLPIQDLFLRVRREVMEKTHNEQVPWESTSLTDHFYFRH